MVAFLLRLSIFLSLFYSFYQLLLLWNIKKIRLDRLFCVTLLFSLLLFQLMEVLDFFWFYAFQIFFAIMILYFIILLFLVLKAKILLAIRRHFR